MQRTTAKAKDQQFPQRANGSKGPTPIDPRDFRHIGGGSPKGGWTDTGVALCSPKGGWA